MGMVQQLKKQYLYSTNLMLNTFNMGMVQQLYSICLVMVDMKFQQPLTNI